MFIPFFGRNNEIIRELTFTQKYMGTNTPFQLTKTITTNSEAPNWKETRFDISIGEWNATSREVLVDGQTTRETPDVGEYLAVLDQYLIEVAGYTPLMWTFKESLQMEVNGTVLREETTLDRILSVITRKRSIGDRSITVTMGEERDNNETRSGSELRARYLELRQFNEDWAQLWQPDG